MEMLVFHQNGKQITQRIITYIVYITYISLPALSSNNISENLPKKTSNYGLQSIAKSANK